MATPAQSPTAEVSPPPPPKASSPGDNATSPARQPTLGSSSPETPNLTVQSPPPVPPLSPPPLEPSPPPPPPTPPPSQPPLLPTVSPPPPEISPPPPALDAPTIPTPPPPTSVPPRPRSPSPPTSRPPPPPKAPDHSPPPPPVPPRHGSLSPPTSGPPPPPKAPESSPPPPKYQKRPEQPSPSRPLHSEHPGQTPSSEGIPQTPKPSPAPVHLPSHSSSSPTPLVISPLAPPRSASSSDTPSQNSPTPPTLTNTSSNSRSTVPSAVLGVSIVVALVLLSLIIVVVWCLRRRKERLHAIGGGYVIPSPMDSSRSDSALLKTQSSIPLVGNRSSNRTFFSQSEPGGFGQSKELFSYEELDKATNGFSDENLLGEGGFGRVYKGVLPDGRVVAVKQLKIGGGQGDREFKAEVETISRVHHRNLLSMVGYCISGNQRLLIYDYVPNNNLYFHLHARGAPGLDWGTRVKIAAGAARGLAYLHEDCHPRIIHRDIKSANILLEDNFHALVADFGLAKLALDCNTHITTRVMGTFGYLAPEYASSGKLTEKSDVFSFGVVLLELITGRKPVDTSQSLGDEGLVEWARPLLSHAIETEEFKDLADPKLGGNYVDAEMFRMIEAAAACIRHSAAKRPRMSQIVRAFDSLAEEDLTNGMRLGESEIIDSAQLSAEIRLFRRMGFGSQSYGTDFFTRNSYNSRDENV